MPYTLLMVSVIILVIIAFVGSVVKDFIRKMKK